MREAEESVQTAQKSERHIPKVIKWKGENMVRNHSFLSTVDEIIEYSKELDLVKVGLIGDQHSGKSTLSQAIAHVIHERHPQKFAVRIFNKHNLLKFEETVKNLEPTNYILIFDDVSFMGANATKNQIDKVRSELTEIRHFDNNVDVKIITIMNYHYTLGLDKYLRTSDFRYFTTVNSSEEDNMEKIVGSKKMSTVSSFQRMRASAITKKYFSMRIGPKEQFAYKWRNPFIPVLFFNPQHSLRMVVTPTREWIQPVCSTCAEALGETSEISVSDFCTKMETNFNPRTVVAAIKLLAYVDGKTTYGRSTSQALRYLNKARNMKKITLEDLLVHYDLQLTRTRLRKKVLV